MNRNRKCMSFTAIVLALTLIISCFSCFGINVYAESVLKTFTPEMAPTGSNEYWPYFNAWNDSPAKEYQSFAVRFKAAASFTGGMMALYVEGDSAKVDVSLYQWNKDYAMSTAGAAKTSTSFNPVAPEGSGSRMEASYSFNEAQDAGEYVAVFNVTSSSPFFPLKSKDMNNNVECYVAGNAVDVDFFGGIMFENSAEGGFKPLVNERITFTQEKESSESNADIFWDYFDTSNANNSFDDFAIRFKTKAPFTGGMISLYVKNTIKLKASLYKWNIDYATSVSAGPQRSVNFDVTGADSRVEGNFSFGSVQPAGEYMVVFEVVSDKTEGDVLIQLKAKDTTAYVECYVAGQEVLVDFFGGILFENYDEGGFEIVEKELQSVPFYDTNAESMPLEISDSYGIQFAVGMSFDKIYISCPSWGDNVGSLRWTLYKWQTSYADTVKGKAIATADFINVVDNHVQYFTFDEEIEKGEYLLLIENITDGTNQVGIWGVAGTSEYVHMYKDGKIYTEGTAAMKIDVVGKNTDYYASLSVADDGGSSGSGSGNSGGNNQPQNPGSGDNTVNVVIYVVIMAAVTCAYMVKKMKKREVL